MVEVADGEGLDVLLGLYHGVDSGLAARDQMEGLWVSLAWVD
jgi:hypothetical protein